MDTVSFGWHDADAVRALRELAREQRIDPATGRRQREDWIGGFMRLALPVAGAMIGAYPARSLVTVEARLAAVLAGDAADHSLIAASGLVVGAERARTAIESLGVKLAAPVTVRRIDLAVELRFRDGTDGIAFLKACQRGLHLPRLRQVPYHATGDARLESIVWQTPKGRHTRIRLYDAGSHHGTHPPGQRLRLEREQRWTGSAAPSAEQVTDLDLAAIFAAPIKPWLNAGTEIRVSTPMAAIELVYGQARSGARTRRSAESLGAKINSLAFGEDLLAPHDRRRRTKAIRDAGIALDRSGDAGFRVVDLHEPLHALVSAWSGAR